MKPRKEHMTFNRVRALVKQVYPNEDAEFITVASIMVYAPAHGILYNDDLWDRVERWVNRKDYTDNHFTDHERFQGLLLNIERNKITEHEVMNAFIGQTLEAEFEFALLALAVIGGICRVQIESEVADRIVDEN